MSSQEEIFILAPRIMTHAPEILVLNLMPGQGGVLAKELVRLGYKGEFFGSIAFADAEELRLAGGALAGARYVDAATTDAFLARYKEHFGGAPGLGAAASYDAMKLLAQALASTNGSLDRAVINRAIRVKDFDGAQGRYSFSFDQRNSYLIPAAVRAVTVQ